MLIYFTKCYQSYVRPKNLTIRKIYSNIWYPLPPTQASGVLTTLWSYQTHVTEVLSSPKVEIFTLNSFLVALPPNPGACTGESLDVMTTVWWLLRLGWITACQLLDNQ
jgi:hypothetical protein